METARLQALVTGGVTVSDAAVRDAYRVQGTKVKFDYAVVSSDDLKKTINPSDADLQAYFKQNAAQVCERHPRDAQDRVHRVRRIEASRRQAAGQRRRDPGLLRRARGRVQDRRAGEDAPHPDHVRRPAPMRRRDAAAKAKAQDVLKQVQAGGNFADLAKKYSEDPGSKDQGGELPLIPTASLDPAYAKAAMALNPGQTSGPGEVGLRLSHHPDGAEDRGRRKAAGGCEGLDRAGPGAAEAGCGGTTVRAAARCRCSRRTVWIRPPPHMV